MIADFIADVQEICPLQQKDVSPLHSHQLVAHGPEAGIFAQNVTQEFGERVSVAM